MVDVRATSSEGKAGSAAPDGKPDHTTITPHESGTVHASMGYLAVPTDAPINNLRYRVPKRKARGRQTRCVMQESGCPNRIASWNTLWGTLRHSRATFGPNECKVGKADKSQVDRYGQYSYNTRPERTARKGKRSTNP